MIFLSQHHRSISTAPTAHSTSNKTIPSSTQNHVVHYSESLLSKKTASRKPARPWTSVPSHLKVFSVDPSSRTKATQAFESPKCTDSSPTPENSPLSTASSPNSEQVVIGCYYTSK